MNGLNVRFEVAWCKMENVDFRTNENGSRKREGGGACIYSWTMRSELKYRLAVDEIMSRQSDIQGEGLPGNLASDPSTSLCPGLLGAEEEGGVEGWKRWSIFSRFVLPPCCFVIREISIRLWWHWIKNIITAVSYELFAFVFKVRAII